MKKKKGSFKQLCWRFVSVGIKYYTKIANLFMNKNQILFICFAGEHYGDNPMYISEELHKLRPKTKIVWLINQPKKNDLKNRFPKYIKVVKKTRFKTIHYLATSLIWVDNDYLVYKKRIEKNKKQLFIETWHGDRGLKKCFYDTKNYKRKYPFSLNYDGYCDYFLTGSTFAEKVVRSMFRYNGNLLHCGYPRNDILFTEDEKKSKNIKAQLGVDDKTKIVLYAPTFRKGMKDFKSEPIDFKRLTETLEKSTKEKWCVVYHTHHLKGSTIDNINVINGNNIVDMSELLFVSDMLITDYSSSFGDFILTGRPAVLYASDYYEYKAKDRGLHFDLESGNFFLAQNNDELNKLVAKITPQKAKRNCKELLEMYGCYENGTATKQVCNIIINKFNNKGR